MEIKFKTYPPFDAFHVPFVPSSPEHVVTMIELAKIKPNEKSADLGSGDGRIVLEFAKSGAQAHGYEIDKDLILKTESKIMEQKLDDRAFIHWKNYWEEDLSEYNIITIYGMTSIMTKLERKLFNELKPGSRIISNVFEFPTLKPMRVENNVYLYII